MAEFLNPLGAVLHLEGDKEPAELVRFQVHVVMELIREDKECGSWLQGMQFTVNTGFASCLEDQDKDVAVVHPVAEVALLQG